MENIRLNINSYVTDDIGDTLDSQSYIITNDYSIYGGVRRKSLPSVNTYVAINFDGITSASFVRVTSDQTISIRLNGSLVLSGTAVVLATALSSLDIKNESGSTANIEYEIAGA